MTTDQNLASVFGWRKASYSSTNGSCVEVGQIPAGAIAVRDTTDRTGPVLCIPPAAWRKLTVAIRAGAVT